MDTTATPRRSNPSVPLTPFDILEAIKILAPAEFVTVSGKVTELRNTGSTGTNSMIYGEIQDFTSKDTISFACPRSHAPEAIGQCVEIRGTVNCRVKFSRLGIDVEITGKVLRLIEPPKFVESDFPILTRSSPRVPLSQYVAENTVAELTLIGTDTAIEDAVTALRRAGISAEIVASIPQVSARMSYEEGILRGLREAMTLKPKAIVFLRGGSDSTIGIWNQSTILKALLELDLPCYLALGHERFISAADQIVDQSFSNPSDFGSSLGKAMLDRAEEIAKNKRIERLRNENDELSSSVTSMEGENSKLRANHEQTTQNLAKVSASLKYWKILASFACGALVVFSATILAKIL
jgi:hypothetical protein